MGKMKEWITAEKRQNGQPVTAIEHMLKDSGFSCERTGWYREFSAGCWSHSTKVCCSMEKQTLCIEKQSPWGSKTAENELPLPENIIAEDNAAAFFDWLDEKVGNYL